MVSDAFDGGMARYMTHEQKYTNEELTDIINQAIAIMTPEMIAREKDLQQYCYDSDVIRYTDKNYEEPVTRKEMLEWTERKYHGVHEIRYGKFFYGMGPVLIEKFGFQSFVFTATDVRSSDITEATFKMADQ